MLKPDQFEIYSDHSYFDMWCLRKKSDRSFENTLHFIKKTEALHTLQTICIWSGYEPKQEDFRQMEVKK